MTVKSKITPEPAGIWLRVSTADQTEASQEPDILAHCQAHGYTVAKRYTLNGKSAYHGKQQDALDEALADLRAGAIRVLVCWSADRLERRGIEETLRVFRLAREAGGRIESVKEPFLSDPHIGGLLGAIVAWVANFESQRKSDRAKAKRDAQRAAGSFAGRPGWGLRPVRLDDGRWTLVPTPEGITYIPQVFARIGRGQTLRAVADWLNAEGVKAPGGGRWWPQVVRGLVTNPVYAGHQVDGAGVVILTCEPLVDAAVFARANAALSGNPKRRGPERKTMLSGVITCLLCGSAMYRTTSGKPGRPRTAYYRCWGSRKDGKPSCGNAVREERADAAVCHLAEATFGWRKVTLKVLVPGDSHEVELAEVAFELKTLVAEFAAGKRTAGEYAEKSAALVAEHERIKALPTTPDTWEEHETGQTYADLWAALEPSERAGWLAGVPRIRRGGQQGPAAAVPARQPGPACHHGGAGGPGIGRVAPDHSRPPRSPRAGGLHHDTSLIPRPYSVIMVSDRYQREVPAMTEHDEGRTETVSMTLRLPAGRHDLLRRAARADGRSLQNLINKILADWLEDRTTTYTLRVEPAPHAGETTVISAADVPRTRERMAKDLQRELHRRLGITPRQAGELAAGGPARLTRPVIEKCAAALADPELAEAVSRAAGRDLAGLSRRDKAAAVLRVLAGVS